MDESALKRALVNSLRAQDGDAFRIEDRYRTGVPDLLMVVKDGPGFIIEAKLIKGGGTRLMCTPMQASYLERFHRPPGFFSAVIAYSDVRGALYIGQPGQAVKDCRFVPRPSRLESRDWLISDLLWKLVFDQRRLDVGQVPTYMK
jgi:hypothetical protein